MFIVIALGEVCFVEIWKRKEAIQTGYFSVNLLSRPLSKISFLYTFAVLIFKCLMK